MAVAYFCRYLLFFLSLSSPASASDILRKEWHRLCSQLPSYQEPNLVWNPVWNCWEAHSYYSVTPHQGTPAWLQPEDFSFFLPMLCCRLATFTQEENQRAENKAELLLQSLQGKSGLPTEQQECALRSCLGAANRNQNERRQRHNNGDGSFRKSLVLWTSTQGIFWVQWKYDFSLIVAPAHACRLHCF